MTGAGEHSAWKAFRVIPELLAVTNSPGPQSRAWRTCKLGTADGFRPVIGIVQAELDIRSPYVGEIPLLGDLAVRNSIHRHFRHAHRLALVSGCRKVMGNGLQVAALRA